MSGYTEILILHSLHTLAVKHLETSINSFPHVKITDINSLN